MGQISKQVKYWIMAITVIIFTPIQSLGCEGNFFFKIDIPDGWYESCIHGEEKIMNLPAFSNEYKSSTPNLRYQVAYAIVMKGDVDIKEYVSLHISKELDTTITESLCYYKNEDFHGYPAISYTFAGVCDGTNNLGKIYIVKANGYSIAFVNMFFPNKSGKRHEIDVWKTLKWYPESKWHF